MNEERTIRGGTMMTWEDHVRCTASTFLRLMAFFCVLMLGTLLLVWGINASARHGPLMERGLVGVLGLFVQDVWPFFVVPFAVALVLLIVFFAWLFLRLPDVNRQLSYEVTRDSLVTRNAANVAVSVPWSNVTRVRNDDYIMRMQIAPGGWRMIFWRAFAAEDRAQVLAWATQADRSPDSCGA